MKHSRRNKGDAGVLFMFLLALPLIIATVGFVGVVIYELATHVSEEKRQQEICSALRVIMDEKRG